MHLLFGIIFPLLFLAFLLYVIWLLVYSMAKGGPYAPLGDGKIQAMIDLLDIKKGEKAADIGAGDGRIVIALAKAGAEAHGYEINPLLVWIARRKIKKAGLQKKAFIHMRDMWKQDFSFYPIITLYITGHAMKLLEPKLQKELKPGSRVAANYFGFPHWKAEKKKDTVFLYTVKRGKTGKI